MSKFDTIYIPNDNKEDITIVKDVNKVEDVNFVQVSKIVDHFVDMIDDLHEVIRTKSYDHDKSLQDLLLVEYTSSNQSSYIDELKYEIEQLTNSNTQLIEENIQLKLRLNIP